MTIRSLVSTHLALLLAVTSNIVSAQALLSDFQASPSLLPDASYAGPLLVGVAGAARVNDADELLPELLDMVEEARRLAAQSDSGVLLLSVDVEPLIQQMREVDGRLATARGDIAAVAKAPFLPAGWYLSGRAEGRLAGTFYFDPEDEQRLRDAVMTAGLSGTDLQSEVRSAGVARAEFALHRNQRVDWLGGVHAGFSLKYQYILLHQRNIRFIEYKEDELFDRGRDTNEFHAANIDFGLTKSVGRWRLTAVLQDLIPYDFDGPISEDYAMRPQLNLSARLDFDFGTLSMDADLLERRGFSHVSDEREYGIDWQMPLLPKLELLAGYRYFDNGVDSGGLSLQLNYRLQEYFVLGFAAEYAGNRELGMRGNVQFFF